MKIPLPSQPFVIRTQWSCTIIYLVLSYYVQTSVHRVLDFAVTSVFILGFWLDLFLRETWCQRKSRNLIVCWSSYLKVLTLFGKLPMVDLWIENRHWECHHWSNLKASRGSREVLNFPFPWTCFCNLICQPVTLKRDLLTSGPFTPCPNMHLESISYQHSLIHSFVPEKLKELINVLGNTVELKQLDNFQKLNLQLFS